jgi:hypothetical protein
MAVKVHINPFERKTIASLERVDRFKGCSVQPSFEWQEGEPDAAFMAKLASEEEKRVGDALLAAKAAGFGRDSMSAAEITRRCQVSVTHVHARGFNTR